MAVVNVSGAAYAHPGGSALFEDVSFRVRSGQHAALVGANGVGKSTLLRCVLGELPLQAGSINADGVVALMPQSIGTGADAHTTVRELLVRNASHQIRDAGLALAAAEAANDTDATDATGMALASAVIGWSEVGGYDQESRWDACCAQVLAKPLVAVADRPVSRLSGGERKRLVLESLLGSDAEILLLDEPDNFLDIPAKRWLEQRLRETPKTILLVSHDRELLASAADAVVTIEGTGAWTHPGSWATYDAARQARNAALGDALGRWKNEERRLFRYFKELKQRASISDGNAAKANAAESRWERFVAVGPPPPPPKARTVRMKLDGADSGRIALRCEAWSWPGSPTPSTWRSISATGSRSWDPTAPANPTSCDSSEATRASSTRVRSGSVPGSGSACSTRPTTSPGSPAVPRCPSWPTTTWPSSPPWPPSAATGWPIAPDERWRPCRAASEPAFKS